MCERCSGPLQVHDVDAERRVAHHPRDLALEPEIPPAQGLLKKSDSRLGHREVRIFVRPWADDALGRRFEAEHEPRHRVGVGVVPSADEQHRRFDRVPVLAHRAVLPVRVAMRMLEPCRDEERLVLQPRQPGLAPALADHLGIGWPRRIGEHRGRPAEILVEQAAALVVDVVRIAVVRRAQGDHRPEGRRSPRRHLQPVEAAPRDSHHADATAAPRLGGEPRDDRDRVVLLLRRVLVLHQPFGIAVAAHVDAHRGVAVPGEIGMRQGIAHRRAVALAIWDVFEDRRHGLLLCIARQPDPRGQPHPVGHRDEHVLDFPDLAREFPDRLHAGSLPSCARLRTAAAMASKPARQTADTARARM